MEVKTHKEVSTTLVGEPVQIKDGSFAIARLLTTKEIAVDEFGLVHGGFTFGLADYACMIAINHPNVVLGSSQVRFTSPVKVGDLLEAKATLVKSEGRKNEVSIEVRVEKKVVLTGTMNCYILESMC